jgi:hypothetical protein
VDAFAVVYGIPYCDPKSGWNAPPVPIDATHALDRGSSGAAEMSVFHALSAGNTGHPPIVGLEPVAGGVQACERTGVPTQPAGDDDATARVCVPVAEHAPHAEYV